MSRQNARADYRYRMRPLLLLLRYLKDGQFCCDVRKTKPPFVCPACFNSEYEAFCEDLIYRGYSQATVDTNSQKVQVLIAHLAAQGVTSSAYITIQHIESYLKTIEDKAVKYIGVFCTFSRISSHLCMNEGIPRMI
ncbi:MAG: hypothetical protein P4L59_02965 [Desulfosporosinus sp.]|nr:hypothetical protein [Desulfosporosinus sp.]